MSDKNHYLDELEKHLDKSKEYKHYATKRFDILMISISGISIGYISNFIKELDDVELFFAYIAQLCMALCFLFNLISQIVSLWSNGLSVSRARDNIFLEKYEQYPKYEKRDSVILKKEFCSKSLLEIDEMFFKSTQKKRSKRINIYDSGISFLNISSFLALAVGLGTFLYFVQVIVSEV